MKKSIRILAVSLALLLVPAVSANAKAYSPLGDSRGFPSESEEGVAIIDSDADTGGASFISHSNTETNTTRLCPTVDTGACSTVAEKEDVHGVLIAPVCSSENNDFCIESLDLGGADSPLVPAKLEAQLRGPTTPGSPALGFPAGGTPSLWSSDLKNEAGSNKYLVKAMVSFSRQPTNGIMFTNLTVAVKPVLETAGSSWTPDVAVEERQTPSGWGVSVSGATGGCAWLSAGTCYQVEDYSASTRTKVTVHVPASLGGWYKGRLAKPTLSVENLNEKVLRISVTAEPVKVPGFFAIFNQTDWEKYFGSFSKFVPSTTPNIVSSRGDAFQYVAGLKQAGFDKVSGVTSTWSFGSLSNSQIFGYRNCLQNKSKVHGLVTTNSMVYNDSPPALQDGFLNYQVAGMHYQPDGKTEVEGTYDLVMSSETARCIYDFSKAPISATVSVVSSDGEVKTAVTSVSENDGWLKLAAYGFTFSSPTIKVKLTQAKAPVATKKSTITCVSTKNKKLIKKVTAAAPKCPVGYKKK